MTQEYTKRIDSLLLDLLAHVQLGTKESETTQNDLRGVIQKEFFYRLIVSLPEDDNKKIQKTIAEKGLNDGQTHDELARMCLSTYSRDHMRNILDDSMNHIVTTYINITMNALSPHQRQEVEEFQKNLLLSQNS